MQFQRAPFRPMTRTVFVPWNQIIVLPPVQINLMDESDSKMPKVKPNSAFSFLSTLQYRFIDGNANDTTAICPDHDHELLRPILTSTWMPNAIGSMAGRSTIFAENQVSFLHTPQCTHMDLIKLQHFIHKILINIAHIIRLKAN